MGFELDGEISPSAAERQKDGTGPVTMGKTAQKPNVPTSKQGQESPPPPTSAHGLGLG